MYRNTYVQKIGMHLASQGGRELSSFRVDGHRGAAKGIYEAHSGVKVNGRTLGWGKRNIRGKKTERRRFKRRSW